MCCMHYCFFPSLYRIAQLNVVDMHVWRCNYELLCSFAHVYEQIKKIEKLREYFWHKCLRFSIVSNAAPKRYIAYKGIQTEIFKI